jgi:hypothetical protein
MNKHIFLLLGASLLLASCSSTPQPQAVNPLQFSAGTYNFQGKATLGTALLLQLVLPDGAPPTQDAEITITGPSGWNNNQPFTATYPANVYTDWELRGTVVPVDGVYKASVKVGAKVYSATSARVSTASKLAIPGNVAATANTSESFTVSWQAVNDAAMYLQQIMRPVQGAPNEIVRGAGSYTKETSVVVANAKLELNTKYLADVLAFNALVTPDSKETKLPAQFNASIGFLPGTFQIVP